MNLRKPRTAVFLFALCLAICENDRALGQSEERLDSSSQLDKLDLAEVLAVDVSVASIKATRLRASPGIVSVVTREDIIAWGARDLLDVLRMVPGFFFGVDVFGVVGVGIRGNWAHEGKILLLIDDFELNDLDVQTLMLGHHFPVESIDRVEIIRGPGSAIYGGNAELGVIRVVTRSAASLEGFQAAARYGIPSKLDSDGDNVGFADLTLDAGTTHKDFAWTLTGFVGRSVRSEATYVSLGTVEPVTLNTSDTTELRPLMIKGSVSYKKTKLQLMFDGFTYENQAGFGEPTQFTHDFRFGGLYADLSSGIALSPNVELTPRVSFKRQEAYFPTWDNEEERQELLGIFFNRHALFRILGGLRLTVDFSETVNLIVGGEAFYDLGSRVGDAEDERETPTGYQDDNGNFVDSIDFFTGAFYAQFLWENPIVNLTVGGRLEAHNVFGVFAVPRLALTKVFDSGLHAKVLASQGFRTPSFQNRVLQTEEAEVTRERTTVFETEVGYRFARGFQVNANAFYTLLQDPIIFGVDGEGNLFYINGPELATAGVEITAQLRRRPFGGQLSYAYYAEVSDPIENYEVPDAAARLGAPQHKVTVAGSVALLPKVMLTSSLTYEGRRFGFVPESPGTPQELDDLILLNVGLAYRDILGSGFEASVYANNLLNETQIFIQPYAGGHAPLPGLGRQFLFRLAYIYDR